MKKFLTSDTAWKIYSVLIAVLLWSFVVVEQNPDSTKTVGDIAVFCTNIDALEQAGLTIVQDADLKAEVKVGGKRLSIAKVDKTNVSASVTVPEIKKGSYEIPIDVKLPIGEVSILDKSPYTARVVVEKMVSEVFPIEVIINGAGAEERAQLKTQLDANSVVLTGPESVIEDVARVYVSIGKGDVGKRIKADLILEDRSGDDLTENLNIQKSFSAVSVSLVKLTSAQTPVQVQTEGAVAEGYSILSVSCTPETVLLGTHQKSDTWLESVLTKAISVEGCRSSFTETVELEIPEEYELLDANNRVKVRIEIGRATE